MVNRKKLPLKTAQELRAFFDISFEACKQNSDIIRKINDSEFYFHCIAKEKLIRTTSIVTRSLTTEGYLRNVERSDNNPHGFLIEKWMILENKDIKIENR